jgi:hypothetical protein
MSGMYMGSNLNSQEIDVLEKYLIRYAKKSNQTKHYQVSITQVIVTDSITVKCRYSMPEDKDYQPLHEQICILHRDKMKNIDYDLTCLIFFEHLNLVIKEIRRLLRRRQRIDGRNHKELIS